MFDFIVNLFITVLTWLYSVLGNNIVLAMVAFTVIIRLAVSPLMISQMRSTAAMQELQPQIKKLQEKYKNDRERLTQAQMELYRERGINPVAGCLPLLVQLPILFALYGAIIYGLSATPFQVIDLSGRLLLPGLDHLIPLNKVFAGIDITLSPQVLLGQFPIVLVLPVLVMATTWLQSKLTMPNVPPNDDGTPNPTASMTRSMITIMPIMYGFFALSFSVGLSIYFIVGNIIGIIQYTVLGKANWRQLFGLPEREEKKKAQAEVDHAMIERIAQRVEDNIKTRRPVPTLGGGGGGDNGSASRQVLTSTPRQTTVKAVKASSNGSSGARKAKTRKRK
jgi:YidC/Oxa1 family membrane protein insertase